MSEFGEDWQTIELTLANKLGYTQGDYRVGLGRRLRGPNGDACSEARLR